MPRILKAVFPVGAYEFLLDRKSGDIVGTRHQFRPVVKKLSGSEVSTDIFLDAQYRGISAVLYSCANACSRPPMGEGSILVHNPTASQPLALGTIPCAREYEAKPQGDDYELSWHPGAVGQNGADV